MKKPWLIQRYDAKDLSLSFANSRVMDVLAQDYMGSAEFEFGSVGKAYRELADGMLDKMLGYSSTFKLSFQVAKGKKTTQQEKTVTVHFMCLPEDEKEVRAFIRKEAEGQGERLKEFTNLNESLTGYGMFGRETYCKHVLWLDLAGTMIFSTNEALLDGFPKMVKNSVAYMDNRDKDREKQAKEAALALTVGDIKAAFQGSSNK